MGTHQSSLADSYNSANITFNGYNRNHRQRLYSISSRRQYSLSNVKRQQRFNDNLSTTSTNLSIVSLSTNSCHSRFLYSSSFTYFFYFVIKRMLNNMFFVLC